ncbi:MAG: hypothetical protein IKS95_02565, partial [Verrucomicrobia bacterium]|nr:hypothetical protein [Verrucomicrobiota bacterium]
MTFLEASSAPYTHTGTFFAQKTNNSTKTMLQMERRTFLKIELVLIIAIMLIIYEHRRMTPRDADT